MNESDWRERISIKSTVCHGKPYIKGTRIWISLILDFSCHREHYGRNHSGISRSDG